MIHISDEARDEIKRVIEEKNAGNDKALRVYVMGHG